jgi:hypothetical protein
VNVELNVAKILFCLFVCLFLLISEKIILRIVKSEQKSQQRGPLQIFSFIIKLQPDFEVEQNAFKVHNKCTSYCK